MKKSARLLSAILIIVLFTAQLNALTVKAASLDEKNAAIVSDAIQRTQQLRRSPKKDYFTTMSDGSTRFVKALAITNLDRPIHGKLLDQSASVVTDTGISWDIPVIWVDKDGNIIHVAIEIDDIVKSYPVFVFYMPEGYSLVLGENSGYDIQMPDFVVDLMKVNGVTTLSIPEGGMTYISAVLPEMDGFKVIPEDTTEEADSNSEEQADTSNDDVRDEEQRQDPGNEDPNRQEDPVPDNPDPGPNHETEEPYLTPETDNDKTPPATDLTYDENLRLVQAHCDENVINIIGVDKLAALVNWVKNTLEPEAVNLLTSKFSAFRKASEKGELGKDLGLYVYYDTYYEEDGTTKDKSRSLASVDIVSDSSGNVKYRLAVNAGGFYERDEETGDYEFNKTDAYSDLDNTLVHELMHAFMSDYTRTGMTGWEYDKSDGTYDLAAEDDIKFPKWFSEGIASTVENAYQYWKDEYYQIFNDDKKSLFSEDVMKKSYKNNPEYNLNGSEEESDYITGYLACLYLSYLRAKQDNKDAISGSIETKDLRVDSAVIRDGLNSILEDLHGGKTLDEIIAKASKVDGKSLYKDTQDFEDKFIIGDSTDKESLKFCTSLLNYMHKSSSGKKTANGSLLIDFSDTNTTQLSKSQLNDTQKAFNVTDSSNLATSTVNKKNALKSGGTSGTGITSSSGSDKAESIGGDFVVADQAARLNNKVPENLVAVKAEDDLVSPDVPRDTVGAGAAEKADTEKDSDKAAATDNGSQNSETVKENSEDSEEVVADNTSESKEDGSVSGEMATEAAEDASVQSSEDSEISDSADSKDVTSDEEDIDDSKESGATKDDVAEVDKESEKKENVSAEDANESEDVAVEPEESADSKEIANGQAEAADNTGEKADEATESTEETADEAYENTEGESEETEDTTDAVEAAEAPEATEVTETPQAAEEITNEETETAENTAEAVQAEETAQAPNDSAGEITETAETVEEPQQEPQEETQQEPQEEPLETAAEQESSESSQDSQESESVEETEPAQESTSSDDEVSEPEESEEISENPIVISETEEEPEPDNSDDNCEQVLDVITEDDSDDAENTTAEEVSD